MRSIDLNADLGEGGAFDQPLLRIVSSASISCGAHAGSEQDIRSAVRAAVSRGVVIGAHPSYPDREHWGRRSLALSATELHASVQQQIRWLSALVNEEGGQVHYIKAHGALYNDAARDQELAQRLVQCVSAIDPSLTLFALAGSQLLEAGRQAGLRMAAEAFVDRRYHSDASLVPRTDARALIEDVDEALQQALCLIHGTTLQAVDGSPLHIQADTLCIHGDTAQALQFATQLQQRLQQQGIRIQALHSAQALRHTSR